MSEIQIMTFYEFKDMLSLGALADIRSRLREIFMSLGIRGTIILAEEGYNGMVCGSTDQIASFVPGVEALLNTRLTYRSSHNSDAPFRKIDIKVKPEIVTLKRSVDVSLGRGTHVRPDEWNQVISDPDTIVLDARNDYEFRTGSFHGAINPQTAKFSDLPEFVERNLDPEKHQRVAMFCTGGIRCEKFAPYLKQRGFKEVYQLEGGILNYLENISEDSSLWHGECFVFDERITVGPGLKKGSQTDLSQRHQVGGE